MQPAQALSVQSYHYDSPPFIGNNEGSLEHREIPHFELAAGSSTEDSVSVSPEKPGILHAPRPVAAEIKLPIEQGLSRSRLQHSRPTSAFGASVPGSPEERELNNSLGNGDFETDAEAEPPRTGTPIKLDLDPSTYHFPRHRLNTQMTDEGKIPLVIVACGSFSPPTYLHLRMFEMAKDAIVEKGKYEIIGGYYSPVSDKYNKPGLAPAIHRVRMCELAVDQTSNWLMVDPWEASQAEYQRTAVVLEHFDNELNQGSKWGVLMKDGSRRNIKIVLLAGGDLIESFGSPGVWAQQDLHVILGRFGCLIIERTGSDVWAFLLSHDILYHHRKNVIVVKQLIYNDISSTKVRLFVRRGMSIKYLLPNSVIQYIEDHRLYRGEEIDFELEEVRLK